MRSHAAFAWLLAGAVMIAPPMAAADDRTPTPSAEELWQTYPLQTDAATATPTATVQERASAPSIPADDDQGPMPLLAAAGAVAIGLATAFVVARRRSEPGSAFSRSSSAFTAPALMAAALTASLPEGNRRSPRLLTLATSPSNGDGAPTRAPARPPYPERAWTVEIEWRDEAGGPRFCALARPEGGRTSVTICSSTPLEWPPTDAASLERLRRAVSRMEEALLASGWTPLPPGPSWYSKRLAWAPLTRTVSTRRFARAGEWPSDSEELWRCEIQWRAGYFKSRFRAVAQAPQQRRKMTIGTTHDFKWLFMDDPKPGVPEYPAEVEQLDARVKAAGWEPAGRGERWFALRYVWRHDTPPPDQIEPAPARTGGAVGGDDDGHE